MQTDMLVLCARVIALMKRDLPAMPMSASSAL